MKYRHFSSNNVVIHMKLDVLVILAIGLFRIPTLMCKNPFPYDRTVDLIAVTRFENIENFYKSQRTLRTLLRALTLEEKTDKLLRRNLCERIFRSDYFEENEEDWIDVYDKNVIESLKIENKVLFEVLFELSKNPVKRFFGYGGSKYVFKNGPYRRYTVSVGNLHQADYAFECLVRERRTRQIKEYFLSRAYNVNASQMLPPIGARFIFLFDRENDKLMVHALAEKPVYIRKLSDIESFYLRNREMYPFVTSRTPESDPICSLAPSNKLRLCAILLNSRDLREVVRFTPTLQNVDLECQKRILGFSSDLAREIATKKNYEEWTIGCIAASVADPEKRFIYYVSRSYSYNNIFVYKFMDDRIFLEYFAGMASMVQDSEEVLHRSGFYARRALQPIGQAEFQLEGVSNGISETEINNEVLTQPSSSVDDPKKNKERTVSGVAVVEKESQNESFEKTKLCLETEETDVQESKLIENNLNSTVQLDSSFAQGSGSNEDNIQLVNSGLSKLPLKDVESSSSKSRKVKKVAFNPNLTFFYD